MENPFNITKEELVELAANKLADQFADLDTLSSMVQSKIEDRVKEQFANGLKERIDQFLNVEMEKLINTEIVPVNIWGDREGSPTTIKAQLAKRAREFWDVRVNEDGRESSYGGEPRHQHLLKKVAKEEFEKAVKSNIDSIIEEFKKALRADAVKMATEHIDKIINIRSR